MADYIDREKFYENEIPYVHEHYTGVSEKPYDVMPVYSMQQIERQPSVDAVEVVRCKDCKHKIPIFNTFQCTELHKEFSDYDFFCKWGEKE